MFTALLHNLDKTKQNKKQNKKKITALLHNFEVRCQQFSTQAQSLFLQKPETNIFRTNKEVNSQNNLNSQNDLNAEN